MAESKTSIEMQILLPYENEIKKREREVTLWTLQVKILPNLHMWVLGTGKFSSWFIQVYLNRAQVPFAGYGVINRARQFLKCRVFFYVTFVILVIFM